MPSEKPGPIYLLPGMTPGYPVFGKLAPLLPSSTIVNYDAPSLRESIAAYAARIAGSFQDESYVVGVSFGGIIAQEICRVLEPRGCIVISSIKNPRELPPWFRIMRLLGRSNCERTLRMAGSIALSFPPNIRSRSTMRLTKLAGSAGVWHRWATASVLGWNPPQSEMSTPLLHIHGDADTTFPIRYVKADITVRGGLHALPISHPSQTANAIKDFLSRT